MKNQYQDQENEQTCKDCNEESYITSNQTDCLKNKICRIQDGTTINIKEDYQHAPSCLCGKIHCTQTTGLYCTKRFDKCSVGPIECSSSAGDFNASDCEVITDRCECSKCNTHYHTADCVPCTYQY